MDEMESLPAEDKSQERERGVEDRNLNYSIQKIVSDASGQIYETLQQQIPLINAKFLNNGNGIKIESLYSSKNTSTYLVTGSTHGFEVTYVGTVPAIEIKHKTHAGDSPETLEEYKLTSDGEGLVFIDKYITPFGFAEFLLRQLI